MPDDIVPRASKCTMDILLTHRQIVVHTTTMTFFYSAPGLSSGDMVQLPNGMPAVVKSVTDTEVEIDANHMLAGKVLVFDIEIDSVA